MFNRNKVVWKGKRGKEKEEKETSRKQDNDIR